MIRSYSYSLTVAICFWASSICHFNNSPLHFWGFVKPATLTASHIHPSPKYDKDNHLNIFTKENQNIESLLNRIHSDNYRLNTVVIDPGHGGHDHGCSGKHSKEKHVALKISKKIGEYINSVYPEINVIYTRSTDVFVPLYTRAAIANNNKADLFISVHCNAISKQQQAVRGTETYVMGLSDEDENLDVAKRENEAILMEENYQQNYDGFDPNSPEGHIILSMVQNAFLEQSILLAEKIEHNFKYMAGRKSRGVKQAAFVVLRKTAMPSVLVESGYLTNSKEENFMVSDRGQDELANAIFRAFQSYKTELEQEANHIPIPAPATIKPKSSPISIPSIEKIQERPSTPPRSEINPAELRKYYTVQLAASTKPLDLSAKKWKKVNILVELKRENGNFKYLAGKFTNLKEANKMQQKLKSNGFKDAFVVAYKGEKRVNLND